MWLANFAMHSLGQMYSPCTGVTKFWARAIMYLLGFLLFFFLLFFFSYRLAWKSWTMYYACLSSSPILQGAIVTIGACFCTNYKLRPTLNVSVSAPTMANTQNKMWKSPTDLKYPIPSNSSGWAVYFASTSFAAASKIFICLYYFKQWVACISECEWPLSTAESVLIHIRQGSVSFSANSILS